MVKKTEFNEFYNDEFYGMQSSGSYVSAKNIIKHLFGLYRPESVIDLGCGVGTWLKAFKEDGVKTIQGYDGNWVKKENLQISQDLFRPTDLSNITIDTNTKYDLSMSVEVAEHLPEGVSDKFVKTLCELSDVVLFSAAIPLQGGENHINEQWQSYWARKFNANNYSAYDAIRPFITGNKDVDWWYQQNTVIYIKNGIALGDELKQWKRSPEQLDWVHPKKYMVVCRRAFQPKFRELVRGVPKSIIGDIKRNIKKKIKSK